MILSPTTASPLAEGLRVLAAWLVVILLMQGFQGALALGGGPRHTHRPAAAGSLQPAHLHLGIERHHHAVGESSVQVVDVADPGVLDTTSLALSLAMSLMAFGSLHRAAPPHRHVLRPAGSWFWRSVDAPPLLRPPRLG